MTLRSASAKRSGCKSREGGPGESGSNWASMVHYISTAAALSWDELSHSSLWGYPRVSMPCRVARLIAGPLMLARLGEKKDRAYNSGAREERRELRTCGAQHDRREGEANRPPFFGGWGRLSWSLQRQAARPTSSCQACAHVRMLCVNYMYDWPRRRVCLPMRLHRCTNAVETDAIFHTWRNYGKVVRGTNIMTCKKNNYVHNHTRSHSIRISQLGPHSSQACP